MLAGSQCETDGSRVVRAQGQFDATFVGGARGGLEELPSHPFKARIAVLLSAPYWDRPAHLFGMDGFVIPIGTFDQTHGQPSAGGFGPIDHALGVVAS